MEICITILLILVIIQNWMNSYFNYKNQNFICKQQREILEKLEFLNQKK